MNRNCRRSISYILALVLCTSFGQTLRAQTYEVIIFDPPAGFEETNGRGLAGFQRVGDGRVAGPPVADNTHAFLWNGVSPTPVDLHPAGFDFSRAFDTDGTHQVGSAWTSGPPTTAMRVAGLWTGTPESFTPLCAAPFCGFSEAYGLGGDQQVGYVNLSLPCENCGPYTIHAALWRGTPASFVDLHPVSSGGNQSRAYDTDGVQQVGYGYFPGTLRPYRALLWSGTAASVVDLSTSGYTYTFAYTVKNGLQLGTGQNISGYGLTPPQVLVWHGTAGSMTDLGQGTPRDTNGTYHVGMKGDGISGHAFRWNAEGGGGLDLHALLPAGVYINSSAERIDEAGNIIGWARREDTYGLVAVLWRIPTAPNQTPTVTLSGLRNNGFYPIGSPLVLNANGRDGDGTVVQITYFANGEMVGTALPGKNRLFSLSWQPQHTGFYRLQAQAVDNAGGVAMSPPVLIRIVAGK